MFKLNTIDRKKDSDAKSERIRFSSHINYELVGTKHQFMRWHFLLTESFWLPQERIEWSEFGTWDLRRPSRSLKVTRTSSIPSHGTTTPNCWRPRVWTERSNCGRSIHNTNIQNSCKMVITIQRHWIGKLSCSGKT